MAREKQYVFSARTTEEGLGLLNKLKADLKIGWDELVVDAICAHYGLDRSALALPKAEKTPKVETKAKAKPKPKAKAKPRPRILTELPGAAEEPEAETAGAAD